MTDVISRIAKFNHWDYRFIGGDQFDGQWVFSSLRLLNSITIAAEATQTVDLSSWLPDISKRYEIIFELRATTGSTSGNTIRVLVGSGSSGNAYYRDFGCITRASGTEAFAGMALTVVNANDHILKIQNTSTGSSAASVTLYGLYYRTIGWNEHDTAPQNQIEKIKIPDGTTVPFGGNNFDGQWYSYNDTELTLLSSATLASSASTSVNISSYIPNDGYAYELLIRGYGRTVATANKDIQLRIGTNSTASSGHLLLRQVARTAAYRVACGNCTLPISATQRKIYFYNSGNDSATNITVQITGIRRIGNNATGNSGYISNIKTSDGTTVPFGGKITDGQWASKSVSVFSSVVFNDTATTNHDYTITNYLPTNNEWYEILVTTYGATGTTSGNQVNWAIYGAPQPTSGVLQQGAYANTRSSSSQYVRTNALIIGKQDDNGNLKIRIRNYGTTKTGSNSVSVRGYRRLGTNE